MSKNNLLDSTKCMENSKSERYENRLLILDPKMLRSEFQKPYFQYFYAVGGFGCKPESLGRKVYGSFLADGEEGQFFRNGQSVRKIFRNVQDSADIYDTLGIGRNVL